MKQYTIENISIRQISIYDGVQIIVFDKNTSNVVLEGSTIRIKLVNKTREQEITFLHSQVLQPIAETPSLLLAKLQDWINEIVEKESTVKKIKGLLSQNLELDPVIVLFQNETDNQIIGYREQEGLYRIRMLGLIDFIEFDQMKTYFNITQSHSPLSYLSPYKPLFSMYYLTGMIMIESTASEGAGLADGLLTNAPFEIEIYP